MPPTSLTLSDYLALTGMLLALSGVGGAFIRLVIRNTLSETLREYATKAQHESLDARVERHYEEFRNRFHDNNQHMQDRIVEIAKIEGRLKILEKEK